MLGSTAHKYFSDKYNVVELNEKITANNFFQVINQINNLNPTYVINCIGAIKQKTYEDKNMYFVNALLPAVLRHGINDSSIFIQPSTDCVFSGNEEGKYKKKHKKDATDIYGRSKAVAEDILNDQKNLILIRTSIIGASKNYKDKGLLSWFKNVESKSVDGFTNHYWNGITTLEWAKQVDGLIISDIDHGFFQIGTEDVSSKYELLKIFKALFSKKIKINKYECNETINRSLESDLSVPSIDTQLNQFVRFMEYK